MAMAFVLQKLIQNMATIVGQPVNGLEMDLLRQRVAVIAVVR